jgi:hypothetical protein
MKTICSPTVGEYRALWKVCVDVSRIAHPFWLKKVDSVGTPTSSVRMSLRMIDVLRIEPIDIGELTPDELTTLLLDADQIRRAISVIIASDYAAALKKLVSRVAVRRYIRAVGEEAFAMAVRTDINFPPEPGGMIIVEPQWLVKARRSALLTWVESMPNGVAQRMRLRFRPSYFNGVTSSTRFVEVATRAAEIARTLQARG